jgi:hypothetical protein
MAPPSDEEALARRIVENCKESMRVGACLGCVMMPVRAWRLATGCGCLERGSFGYSR